MLPFEESLSLFSRYFVCLSDHISVDTLRTRCTTDARCNDEILSLCVNAFWNKRETKAGTERDRQADKDRDTERDRESNSANQNWTGWSCQNNESKKLKSAYNRRSNNFHYFLLQTLLSPRNGSRSQKPVGMCKAWSQQRNNDNGQYQNFASFADEWIFKKIIIIIIKG